MKTKNDKRIADLIDLLRLERAAIRDADFTHMAALIDRKEAALAEIRDLPVQKLRKVREMSLANQRLLDAAMQGIRAAQARLSVIQRNSRSFQSYDSTGKGQTISGSAGSVEKRA